MVRVYCLGGIEGFSEMKHMMLKFTLKEGADRRQLLKDILAALSNAGPAITEATDRSTVTAKYVFTSDTQVQVVVHKTGTVYLTGYGSLFELTETLLKLYI